MSTTAVSTPIPANQRRPPTATQLSLHTTPTRASRAPAPTAARHGSGGRVLFEVSFASAMSDSDLARLARVLDLSTHMHPKMRPDPTSPGVVRLDHFSGLFLERGETAGQWVLEARTWGNPTPESVHEWHLLAAGAAHQLDPAVPAPERLSRQTRLEVSDPAVGEVLNRPLAAPRRHLVGLP
jgi:hypothetical protein